MMGFEVTMGSLGSKTEKRHSHEKYENSYKIKTNYVILKAIVKASKKSPKGVKGQSVSYFSKSKKSFNSNRIRSIDT